MSALSKGAGPGKETLEPLLGKRLSIPDSLPQAGQSWKKPLEISPRETGKGAGLAPASQLLPPQPSQLLQLPQYRPSRGSELFL